MYQNDILHVSQYVQFFDMLPFFVGDSKIFEIIIHFVTEDCVLINFSGGLVPSAHTLGSIEFKNIVFSYPSRSESLIFNDLTLTVPPGQITAVVGSSGSGKSTLGSLLLRFYDPQKGELPPRYRFMCELYTVNMLSVRNEQCKLL
jgi:ABC-type multidrug transport system fused ATPase/permease subunit